MISFMIFGIGLAFLIKPRSYRNNRKQEIIKRKGTYLGLPHLCSHLAAQVAGPAHLAPSPIVFLLCEEDGCVAAVRAHAPRPPPACRSPSLPWTSLAMPHTALALSHSPRARPP